LIEAQAVRWLLVVSGVIAMTLIAPPIGVVLIMGLVGCGVYRTARRLRRKRELNRAAAQVYWTPERIQRTYYR
jgi:predicted PurR-regulated permease PerM